MTNRTGVCASAGHTLGVAQASEQTVIVLCQVLSSLLALAGDGSLEPPAKRARLFPGFEAAAAPARLIIEEPLAGYSEEALTLLLTFIYTPGSEDGTSSIKGAVAAGEWVLLAELVWAGGPAGRAWRAAHCGARAS